MIHFNSKAARLLPKGTIAFTWGLDIYVAGPTCDIPTLLHEAAHVVQFRQLGKFRFVVLYVSYRLWYGYRLNPLEVEAREFAEERLRKCSTQENESFLLHLGFSAS